MGALLSTWNQLTSFASSKLIESIVLLTTRIALGGIFWRSYSNSVVEGTWFEIEPIQYLLFREEFSGLPLSPEFAAPLTAYAEFLFPVLLFAGLFSRIAAGGLFVMALVIQLFVYPTWAHFLGWDIMVLAMAGLIMSRGPGMFSLDWLIGRVIGTRTA